MPCLSVCVYVQVMSQDVGSALPEAATLSFHEALQVCVPQYLEYTQSLYIVGWYTRILHLLQC